MKTIIIIMAAWFSLGSSYSFTVDGPQPSPYITDRQEVKVTVTAYNPGDPNQTDDTPCIGPRNVNICEEMKTKNVCAANFVPLGTIIHFGNGLNCIVLDRTSSKFADRVDIAVASYEEAVEWGRQYLTIDM